MGLVPKRSWLGVFVAFYIHLWRAHRKLLNAPQDLESSMIELLEAIICYYDLLYLAICSYFGH